MIILLLSMPFQLLSFCFVSHTIVRKHKSPSLGACVCSCPMRVCFLPTFIKAFHFRFTPFSASHSHLFLGVLSPLKPLRTCPLIQSIVTGHFSFAQGASKTGRHTASSKSKYTMIRIPLIVFVVVAHSRWLWRFLFCFISSHYHSCNEKLRVAFQWTVCFFGGADRIECVGYVAMCEFNNILYVVYIQHILAAIRRKLKKNLFGRAGACNERQQFQTQRAH